MAFNAELAPFCKLRDGRDGDHTNRIDKDGNCPYAVGIVAAGDGPAKRFSMPP